MMPVPAHGANETRDYPARSDTIHRGLRDIDRGLPVTFILLLLLGPCSGKATHEHHQQK